jgi:hypothetical protein
MIQTFFGFFQKRREDVRSAIQCPSSPLWLLSGMQLNDTFTFPVRTGFLCSASARARWELRVFPSKEV